MIICKKCSTEKGEELFYYSGKYYHSWCKPCVSLYMRQKYQDNMEAMKERNRAWDVKNRVARNMIARKYRKKKMEEDLVGFRAYNAMKRQEFRDRQKSKIQQGVI